jgi:hypothetical protein
MDGPGTRVTAYRINRDSTVIAGLPTFGANDVHVSSLGE